MKKTLFSLLCFMILSLAGKASVVVTDLAPDSTKSVSGTGGAWAFAIDVDNNFVEDYNFNRNFGKFGAKTLSCYGPAGNNISVTGTPSAPGNKVAVNGWGVLIDSNSTWGDATLPPYIYISTLYPGFADSGNRFIGVRFYNDTNVHYGWILINFNLSLKQLTVLSYAYETIPGKGITTPSSLGTPLVNFSASATTTDTKTIVTLSDLSGNSPTAWEWTFTPATVTFEAGTGPTSQNPQVTFNALGKYTVKLKATNTTGSDSLTQTDYVTIISAPVVDFTAGMFSADTKTPIDFTDASTYTPTAWEWIVTPATVSYVSGTAPTSQNPRILFNAAGKYEIKLKATNSIGTDSLTKIDYITIYTTPAADFTASTVSTDTKTTVSFTETCTNNPTDMEWKFTPSTVTYMAGTGAKSRNPQVMFNVAGKYTVELKASNIAGINTKVKAKYITVIDTPTTPPKTSISGYQAGNNNVIFYPNPASKVFIVECPGNKGTITILDLNGRVEFSQQITSKKMQLNVGDLPKGHHILRISDSNGVSNTKLLLE